MNTTSSPVTITNYDEIVKYFQQFPEHLHAPVSDNESRPIRPLDNNTHHKTLSTN